MDLKRGVRSRLHIVVLTLALAVVASHGQTPREISFQGVLTDVAGLPVADGAHTVSFRLYAGGTGGDALWTETQTVTTRNGLFSVALGSVSPLAATACSSSSRRQIRKRGRRGPCRESF